MTDMLLQMLHKGYMDEAGEVGDTGGGGGDTTVDLTVDIDKASDAIGADLGLNDGAGTDDLLDGRDSSVKKEEGAGADKQVQAPPKDEKPEVKAAREARERASAAAKPDAAKQAEQLKKDGAAARKFLEGKVADPENLAKRADADVVKLMTDYKAKFGEGPRALPKSWKADMQPHWSKLDPAVQAYVEQREAEALSGITQYGEAAKFAKSVQSVFEPYRALLDAQKITDPLVPVQYLMRTHAHLSNGSEEHRIQSAARLMKSYQVDPEKLLAAMKTETPYQDETTKALAKKVDSLQASLDQRQQHEYDALGTKVAAEVRAFAEDPAHLYFAEVGNHIALLLQDPKIQLPEAYEMAVYANPVTREKELGRIRTEAAEKTRKEAEEAALKAEKARGTRVKGDEKHRASPDFLGTMEDTLHETLADIKGRG